MADNWTLSVGVIMNKLTLAGSSVTISCVTGWKTAAEVQRVYKTWLSGSGVKSVRDIAKFARR
jgi:hypothetical protein